eukprot:4326102-Alexandrium_andersonii.AAC.1
MLDIRGSDGQKLQARGDHSAASGGGATITTLPDSESVAATQDGQASAAAAAEAEAREAPAAPEGTA